eukprot:CAMPEP_0171801998 /NCGR_PEP_ID=MMETSP0991-20121206/72567_1 /TAXON_ID=483369 /ORGANISM="non described non described, Strain CCMP2098" /LENGTH=215 /DNA_ID=CAMNT_0012413723 /DNA_START=139 /DNA_END=787 /DNA_ORIENTATION=-
MNIQHNAGRGHEEETHAGGLASTFEKNMPRFRRRWWRWRVLVMSRGGWLAVFLLSLSLTTVVMSGFEHTLAEQIELAYFVPLLIGHGGNAGGQTVGTVLSAMSSGQVGFEDWGKVVVKECLAGLGSGTLTCVAVLPLLYIMKISKHVSAVILCTLPALTILAAGLGAGLPFLVAGLGADPAVIAAPAMTTLVDVGGLLLYFLIARVVFSAFGLKI